LWIEAVKRVVRLVVMTLVVGAEVDDRVVEGVGRARVIQEEAGVGLLRQLLEQLANFFASRLVADDPAAALEVGEEVDAAVAVA
jgi:hypothetical protein